MGAGTECQPDTNAVHEPPDNTQNEQKWHGFPDLLPEGRGQSVESASLWRSGLIQAQEQQQQQSQVPEPVEQMICSSTISDFSLETKGWISISPSKPRASSSSMGIRSPSEQQQHSRISAGTASPDSRLDSQIAAPDLSWQISRMSADRLPGDLKVGADERHLPCFSTASQSDQDYTAAGEANVRVSPQLSTTWVGNDDEVTATATNDGFWSGINDPLSTTTCQIDDDLTARDSAIVNPPATAPEIPTPFRVCSSTGDSSRPGSHVSDENSSTVSAAVLHGSKSLEFVRPSGPEFSSMPIAATTAAIDSSHEVCLDLAPGAGPDLANAAAIAASGEAASPSMPHAAASEAASHSMTHASGAATTASHPLQANSMEALISSPSAVSMSRTAAQHSTLHSSSSGSSRSNAAATANTKLEGTAQSAVKQRQSLHGRKGDSPGAEARKHLLAQIDSHAPANMHMSMSNEASEASVTGEKSMESEPAVQITDDAAGTRSLSDTTSRQSAMDVLDTFADPVDGASVSAEGIIACGTEALDCTGRGAVAQRLSQTSSLLTGGQSGTIEGHRTDPASTDGSGIASNADGNDVTIWPLPTALLPKSSSMRAASLRSSQQAGGAAMSENGSADTADHAEGLGPVAQISHKFTDGLAGEPTTNPPSILDMAQTAMGRPACSEEQLACTQRAEHEIDPQNAHEQEILAMAPGKDAQSDAIAACNDSRSKAMERSMQELQTGAGAMSDIDVSSSSCETDAADTSNGGSAALTSELGLAQPIAASIGRRLSENAAQQSLPALGAQPADSSEKAVHSDAASETDLPQLPALRAGSRDELPSRSDFNGSTALQNWTTAATEGHKESGPESASRPDEPQGQPLATTTATGQVHGDADAQYPEMVARTKRCSEPHDLPDSGAAANSGQHRLLSSERPAQVDVVNTSAQSSMPALLDWIEEDDDGTMPSLDAREATPSLQSFQAPSGTECLNEEAQATCTRLDSTSMSDPSSRSSFHCLNDDSHCLNADSNATDEGLRGAGSCQATGDIHSPGGAASKVSSQATDLTGQGSQCLQPLISGDSGEDGSVPQLSMFQAPSWGEFLARAGPEMPCLATKTTSAVPQTIADESARPSLDDVMIGITSDPAHVSPIHTDDASGIAEQAVPAMPILAEGSCRHPTSTKADLPQRMAGAPRGGPPVLSQLAAWMQSHGASCPHQHPAEECSTQPAVSTAATAPSAGHTSPAALQKVSHIPSDADGSSSAGPSRLWPWLITDLRVAQKALLLRAHLTWQQQPNQSHGPDPSVVHRHAAAPHHRAHSWQPALPQQVPPQIDDLGHNEQTEPLSMDAPLLDANNASAVQLRTGSSAAKRMLVDCPEWFACHKCVAALCCRQVPKPELQMPAAVMNVACTAA